MNFIIIKINIWPSAENVNKQEAFHSSYYLPIKINEHPRSRSKQNLLVSSCQRGLFKGLKS
jgi:hypothetical protein